MPERRCKAPALPSSRPAPRPALLRAFVLAAWLLWSLTFVKYALVFPLTMHGIDYIKHRRAALAVVEGRSPYTDENFLRFNYPQFAAWVFVFLAWAPESAGETVWDLCNAAFLAATLAVVILGCRPRAPQGLRPADRARQWAAAHWHAVAALAMGVFAPAFVGNHYANIEPFNLLLCATFLALMLHGRDGAAGLALAALCLVKILPALMLAPLWLGGRRRAVGWCLAAIGAYALVLAATGWWRHEWFLLREVLPRLAFEYRDISNAPAAIAVAKLAPAVWKHRAAYDLVCRVFSAAAFGVFAVVTVLGRRAGWREGVGFASLSAVLITPLFEYIHLIWAMPAYLLLAVDWVEGRVSSRLVLVLGAMWAVVFALRYMQEVANFSEPLPPRQVATFFVAALWVAAGAQVLAARRPAGAGADA